MDGTASPSRCPGKGGGAQQDTMQCMRRRKHSGAPKEAASLKKLACNASLGETQAAVVLYGALLGSSEPWPPTYSRPCLVSSACTSGSLSLACSWYVRSSACVVRPGSSMAARLRESCRATCTRSRQHDLWPPVGQPSIVASHFRHTKAQPPQPAQRASRSLGCDAQSGAGGLRWTT